MSDLIIPNFHNPIAKKVCFRAPIFEDDFVESGMTAWFVRYEWIQKNQCYKLYFDFEDFEEQNKKYFAYVYFSNRHTKELGEKTGRTLFTAVEAGYYTPKYSAYYSIPAVDYISENLPEDTRNDRLLQRALLRDILILLD